MPFLTDKGVTKLKELQSKISEIHEKKYDKPSDYSKTMASHALQIIDYILQNNDKSVRSLDEVKKLIAYIEPFIKHIDNKTFTAVPSVFNDQSMALAIAFRDFLKRFDLKADAKPEINFVLQMKQLFSKAPETAILNQHIREVESAIRMYHLIISAKRNCENANVVMTKIMQQKELYKTVKIESDEVISAYKKTVDELLQEIIKQPSVSLQSGGIVHYVNQTSPFEIDTSDLVAVSLVSKLFMELLDLEDQFNKLLPPSSRVSCVLDYILTVYTKDRVAIHKQNVLDQLTSAEAEIKAYLPGSHLRVFQSIPLEKKKLMQNILSEIQKAKEIKSDDGVSRSAFTLYKELAKATTENLHFSQRNRISPGECGRILSTYQPIMLELAMERPVGSDEQYFHLFVREKEKRLRLNGAEADRCVRLTG